MHEKHLAQFRYLELVSHSVFRHLPNIMKVR